jgi:transcriptional regulator with XRE-family HTH domain
MKRSSVKRITREAKIIRYMRLAKSIPTRRAGELVGVSGPAIIHYEHGRMDLSLYRIEQLVQAYGYTMEHFRALLGGEEIPILSLREECANLINALDERKLKLIHFVLLFVLLGFTT